MYHEQLHYLTTRTKSEHQPVHYHRCYYKKAHDSKPKESMNQTRVYSRILEPHRVQDSDGQDPQDQEWKCNE